MIRFEVDGVNLVKCGVVARGRVHLGTIRIGSVFTSIEELLEESTLMKLQVDGITAYGHGLNNLPEGMTGELLLTGEINGNLGYLKSPVIITGIY